ncbi:DUF2207 domain-containing protein [Companilactobacillus nantensis]|uniref:Integral membrane protein n=1 Tax=Companilactobacillus nantensis DSM 16982 TaxID=1423774 RepID=A0A0R1WBH5_9LACO|nr:DUF2207 domain-containing protein [Companilactobacillus nantensis]KRM15005.1 integral membrane protein [Companilactobacillus nantensis DSM 16982]GEO64960.1 membrane protein [Companilactobacillus nantensis]
MKKFWGVFLTFLGILLALHTTSINVFADNKYRIKNYNIVANVQKNGDIEMTQRLNYQFDGDFHGVYYNQSLNKLQGVTQPKVYIDTGSQVIPAKESNSGADNTVKVTKTKKKLGLKVYHEVSTSDVTFIYKYTLKGAVINYNDTAVMNWLILSGWDNVLSNIKITINLPEKNIPQLQAWAHGPLLGHNQVNRKKGQVVMTVPELTDDDSIRSKMLFPVSVTSANPNVVHKDMKAKVRAEEKQYAIAANQSRRKQDGIYWSLMVFGILVIAAIYLYKIIAMKKYPATKHQIPTPLYHSFDAPEFLPSFSKVILERLHDADSISLTADLMNEVGHRRMKLEKLGNTFEITALVPPTNDFFKYMINDVGDGKKVTLRAIKNEAKDYDGKKRVSDNFDNWAENAVKNREQYLDLHNMDIVKGFSLAAITTDIIAAIMFMITLLFNKPLLWPAVILVTLAVLVWIVYWLIRKRVTPYTDKGEIAVNQIRAFKRMLEDIDDIKMAEVGDIILWEQFIPYAVAFGISEKVIKALKVQFTPEQLGQSIAVVNYIGFTNSFGAASSGFQTAFIGAIGASGSASISGGSGGFSGGGGGGGFGGGSGGAF